MASGRVLVVGATGQLGSVVTRKLLATGVPVRALARNAAKLAELGAAGADVARVDLLDLPALTIACQGVDQIVATANNNMGKGATSPARVDLTAYQNLCAAARKAAVRRLLFVSFRGVDQDAIVDIFRVKWYIEDAIRRSGVPYVFLRPTALLDIWVDELVAGDIRRKGSAMIFGDGNRASNYIAVDDVAEFALKILARPEIVNEAIEVGGPSDVTLNEIASLVERRLGGSGKRRRVPLVAMRVLPKIVRPFNEVAARLMTIGLYPATVAKPFPEWKKAADRFDVTPRTVEAHVERLPRS